MKFLKIRLNKGGFGDIGRCIWVMSIDTIEDLLRYADAEAEWSGYALTSYDRNAVEKTADFSNHGEIVSITDALCTTSMKDTSPRESSLIRLLAAKVASAKEGEQVYPISVLADYLDRKTAKMAELIDRGWRLMIQKSGGYCDLDGFIEQWDGQILETIQKDGVGFPTDDGALMVETLILENGEVADKQFVAYSTEYFKSKSIGAITLLKSIDESYIYKCICNSKNIAISTQADDDRQVESFVNLFLAVKEQKNILLRITDEGKSKIMSNPLFAKVHHNVIFEKF